MFNLTKKILKPVSVSGREEAVVGVIAEEIANTLSTKPIPQRGVIEATEALVGSVLATKTFNVIDFWSLLTAVELDLDQLFKQYVGKNVLNMFRQDHGYKEGTYIKIWHGREDNEHLSDILAAQVSVTENFAEQVYQALRSVYQTL